MPLLSLGALLTAGTGIALAATGGYAAWRHYRRRNEVFITYPTMFGTARIFTVRRDPDQDILDQFGKPLASAQSNSATASEASDTSLSQRNDVPLSDTNSEVVTEPEITWVRVLEIGGALQSATYLDDDRCYDLVFDYYKLYNHLFEANIPIQSMLMFGGGGYAYPKFIISHFPDICIDVVEIDPAITSLAERYFFLDRLIEEFETESTGRLGLFNEDGRAFLENCDKTYDVVLNDTFAGKQPALQLSSLEAMQLVKEHLSPGGMYLTNVVSSLAGPASRTLRLVCNTLACVFSNVYILSAKRHLPNESENYIVIATDGDYSFSGTVQRPQFTRTNEILKDSYETTAHEPA